jgi:hypothetical protein
MSSYRLKLGRTLDVPVKFTLRDGAKEVPFTVTLTIKRLVLAEFTDLLDRVKAQTLEDRALLGELVLGWEQGLVLGEDDKPAPYGAEALDTMCSVVGLQPELVRAVFDALTRSFSPAAQADAKLGN